MKLRAAAALKLRTYDLIERAVEEGVELGVRRAFKHFDEPESPSQWAIVDALNIAVMSALCEVIDFDDDEEEAAASCEP